MTTLQIHEKLAEIGLTNNQIQVYLDVLQAKKCRAGEIIDHSKLHRSIVYTALDDLVAMGLVSKLAHGGVAVFEVTDPKNLVEMIDDKRRAAESVADDLTKMMQEAPRDIRVYEGIDGVLSARERSLALKKDETLYVFSGSSLTTTPEYEAMWAKFHKKRVEKGIKQKILFDRSISPEIIAKRNALGLTQAKYLPFKQDMPAWFEAYGQIFAVGVPGQEQVVFSMNSPEAATSFKNFFEYLWNQNVMVESGRTALQQATNSMLDELKPGEEYSVLGASFGQYNRPEMMDFYGQYHKKRVAKGVAINMLAFNESAEQIKQLFRNAGDPDFKISHIKTLDPTTQNPMQVYLYHDKAMVVVMGENPTIMRFDQKEIYDNFRAYFDGLWQKESYVVQGPEALQHIWFEAVEAKELRFIGARGYFIDRYPKLFAEVKKRAEQTPGVVWKNIVDPGMRGHTLTKFSWSKTKYVLAMPKNPNVVWLYGDKAVIVSWAGDEPVMFISTNPQLVQSYNDNFEEMWSRA